MELNQTVTYGLINASIGALLTLLVFGLRRDMRELRTELNGDIAELGTELKGDISDLRTELKGDISGLRTERKGGVGELRTDLMGDLRELRTDIRRLDGKIDALRSDLTHLAWERRDDRPAASEG